MRTISLIIDDQNQNRNGEAEQLFLDQFKDVGGTLHFGIAEEIDAEGNHAGAVGLFTDVANQSGEPTGRDAYLIAYMHTGGIYDDCVHRFLYHALEIFHLAIWYAGEVVPA